MSFEIREVEYNGVTTMEYIGMATLTSLPGTTVLTHNNEAKTKYRLANISFEAPDGSIQKMATKIYQTSIDKMALTENAFTVGEQYMTTLRAGADKDGKMRLWANTSSAVMLDRIDAEAESKMLSALGVTVTEGALVPDINEA